jgi:hypothetical protein
MKTGHAEAEYTKLKGVIENLTQILETARAIDLQQAELNLKANAHNPDAMSNLERNLRNARVRIMSDLASIMTTFR